MRRPALWGALAFLAVLAVSVAAAQATRAHANTPTLTSATTTTTTAAAQTQTPVQVGAQLYAANCQTCHGKNGQGGKFRGIGGEGLGSFAHFKNLILYGRERMPGYAKTGLSTSDSLGALGANGYLGNATAPTDQQIQDLLAYLETLSSSHRGGFFGGDD